MMLLVALLACQQLQAKKHPFVTEGKQWNYRAENFFGDGYDFRFFIEGDTLIGGETWKKLYTVDEPRYGTQEPVYCGALKEDSGGEDITVSFIRTGHENVEKLYNFSPTVGDQFFYGENYATVTDVDEIAVRGIHRHRVKLLTTDAESPWPGSEDNSGYWVEGIGSSAGLLTPIDFMTTGYAYVLLSCVEDGKVVFTGKDFGGASNGLTDIAVSSTTSSHAGIAPVYDLQVRRTSRQQLRRGIYISGGRKVVMK